MKIHSFLLVALVASSASAGLVLRSNTMDPQLVRRLNANTDLINEAIELLLPPANTALQGLIPDPIDIPVDESLDTGAMTENVGDCTGLETISVGLTLGQLTGQSSTEIQSLTVREGTESVSCGCCPTEFSGTFDIVLSADDYTVDGTVSLTTTPNCGSATSNVTITVLNPTFNGVLFLSGEVSCDDANIKNVNVTSLNATCDNITTTYDPALPEFLANAQQEVNDFISDEVKTFLSETFVDTLALAIDAALEAARRSWSFLTGAGWVASFARANAATAAGNFVRYGLGFGN